MNEVDEDAFRSSERTKTALKRVGDLAEQYADEEGTLEFYGTPAAEALSELRAESEGDLDYRSLLADVPPVATTPLSKVRERHVDAVDTVRRVHDRYEYVVTVARPDEQDRS